MKLNSKVKAKYTSSSMLSVVSDRVQIAFLNQTRFFFFFNRKGPSITRKRWHEFTEKGKESFSLAWNATKAKGLPKKNSKQQINLRQQSFYKVKNGWKPRWTCENARQFTCNLVLMTSAGVAKAAAGTPVRKQIYNVETPRSFKPI